MPSPLIIVTRGSPLALQQAKDAAQHLEKSLQWKTEIKILTTTGDRQALQLANTVTLTRRRQKCMRFCFAYGKITGRKSVAKVEVKVFGGQMLWSAL